MEVVGFVNLWLGLGGVVKVWLGVAAVLWSWLGDLAGGESVVATVGVWGEEHGVAHFCSGGRG